MKDTMTPAEMLELLDELRARRNGHDEADGEWPTPLVDWELAYGAGEDPARWLYEPLLPDQGAVAIFAKGGLGKSLLALWLAAELTTRAEPVDVLYLDYEMTLATVVDRLEAMGHDEPTQLGRLHYASLPSLAPLDTLEGGQAVVKMATGLGVALVVIDTFGRAVNGDEDSADTVRAWYRWTGQRLKTAGVGFLRIDHAGKNLERGQRGSSAKNDDVDLVWEMTERGHGEFMLRATKRRVDWIAERVVIRQTNVDGVLAYDLGGGGPSYLAGTAEVAAQLDALGAAVDISRRQAMTLLREHGQGRANNVVGDAVKYRRQDHPRQLEAEQPRTEPGTQTKPLEYIGADQSVPPCDAYPSAPAPYVVGRHWEREPVRGLFDD